MALPRRHFGGGIFALAKDNANIRLEIA